MLSIGAAVPKVQPSRPPAPMRRAIEAYVPRPGFTLLPPAPSEKSLIHYWGVRVTYGDDNEVTAWICLAEEPCRSTGTSIFVLSANRTSHAAEHLRIAHQITSSKTDTEVRKKRKEREVVQDLEELSLFRNDGKRFDLLVNALNVVNNNLAIQSVEHPEFKVAQKMLVKEDIQTTLNRETVTDAIVELYVSTKQEVSEYLLSNCGSNPNLTMMADFWTCKTTSAKFLGMRVYLVDSDWKFKSVLLGTRRFNPLFGDRDGGIQQPFLAWIDSLLDDFGLKHAKFFGASSDAGSDVKSMMCNVLELEWE